MEGQHSIVKRGTTPCMYCGRQLPRDNPGAVSTHYRSRRCQVDRVEFQVMKAKRPRPSFMNDIDGPSCEWSEPTIPEAPDCGLEDRVELIEGDPTQDERVKRRAVEDRLREMRTRKKVQLWFDQGVGRRSLSIPSVSDSQSENIQTDDEVIDALEEEEDGDTWEESFIDEVRFRWAQLIDPPPDSTIPGLPVSVAKKVFDLIEFVIDQLGAERGIEGKDVFGTMGLSGYEKIVKEYLGKDRWCERYFTSTSGSLSCQAIYDADIMPRLDDIVRRHWDVLEKSSRYDSLRYDHPCTGKFMKEQGRLVSRQRRAIGDRRPGEDIILLVSLYSDKTLLANKGSASIHPVVVGVANLPPSLYQDELMYLGFLNAKVEETGTRVESEEMARVSKRELLSQQLAAMTYRLKECSFAGREVVITTRETVEPRSGSTIAEIGRERSRTSTKVVRYFPALFDMPVDHPETTDILCLYRGYCGECLWKTSSRFPEGRRTESNAREELKGSMRATSQRCNETASYRIACGLWGFNGSCPPDQIDPTFDIDEASRSILKQIGTRTDWTDLNRAIGPERLHDLDSGLTVHVREAILTSLKNAKWKDGQINEINSALRDCVLRESRWQGFRYPPEKREVGSTLRGYLGGTSRVEAVEHRTMLQVWVPVLCRFLPVDSPQVRLAAAYTRYYMVRERRDLGLFKRYHSPETLNETEKAFEYLKSILILPEFRDRGGKGITSDKSKKDSPITEISEDLEENADLYAWEKLPKLHSASHFTERVRREGFSDIVTGEVHESSHRTLKRFYSGQRTNRQSATVVSQIATLQRRSHMTRMMERPSRSVGTSEEKFVTYHTVAKETKFTDIACLTRPENARKAGNCTLRLKDLRDWVIWSRQNSQEAREKFPSSWKETGLARLLSLHFSHWALAAALLDALVESLGLSRVNGNIDDLLRMEPNAQILVVRNGLVPSPPSTLGLFETKKGNRSRCLQRLRANQQFGRIQATSEKSHTQAPWLDSIALHGYSKHQGDRQYYGRIMMMFYMQSRLKSSKFESDCTGDESAVRSTHRRSWLPMLLIRYFMRTEDLMHERKRFKEDLSAPLLTELCYAERDVPLPNALAPNHWWFTAQSPEAVLGKIHVVAGNLHASRSLILSTGSADDFYDDSNAKFFLNHYVWERKGFEPYEILEGDAVVDFEENEGSIYDERSAKEDNEGNGSER